MKIRILPEASRDIELGGDFYESRQGGLGEYFISSTSSDIESLRIFGGIHQKHHGLFRMLSKRFPFAINYEIQDNAIKIYAVLD
ncbi:MAG: type II toxin-antitoxin system RelE/ParE family toxin, partial [Thermodesulfobacteriota bacterium]